MWLAESYQFTPDFKQLTIKTRSGINWSDGTPFSAEDVAYTLNTLRDLGPKVKWGVDVQQALKEATATDPNTVVLNFKIPSPRFFFFVTYKYDIGIYIVPKHIFDGQDWTTFKHFDIAKGWPVTTGPWKVTEASLQQKVFDRRARVVGGGAEAGADAADRAQHLAASCGRTGDGAGADHQPGGFRRPVCSRRRSRRCSGRIRRSPPIPARSRRRAMSIGGRSRFTSTTR